MTAELQTTVPDRAAHPGHGEAFTDHMITADWTPESGWQPARLGPLRELTLHPGTLGLHYGQVIFEGLKAFRQPDGSMAVFRPWDNARRFQSSARRLAMPPLPEALFVDAVGRLVAADAALLPENSEHSIYIRPFMFAVDRTLMLRPSTRYRFVVVAFIAGAFFGESAESISVWVNRDYARAMPGGTGDVKIAGNYAPTFVAQLEAERAGCQQVLWLDSTEHRWIEEMSGMNVFLVRGGGSRPVIVTPPLTGTLLPGVTRDTVMKLAVRLGLTVREERVSLERWRTGSGKFTEAFACGTAAVITAVGEVCDGQARWPIGDGKPGPVTTALRAALIDAQRGRTPDADGWLHPVLSIAAPGVPEGLGRG